MPHYDHLEHPKSTEYFTSAPAAFTLSLSLAGALVGISLLSGVILASNTTLADDTIEADVAVSVPVSCVMTSNLDSAHSANINAGTYRADIGKTTLNVVCNENSGFSIYAIGYSNEEYGNNKLLATVGGQLAPTYDIVTGTAESGSTSNWAMKLNPVTTGSYVPTIENGYDSYSNVPTTYTKVATFASSTDAVIGASVEATYATYIASDQPAGTYNGKVKYTMVHPASEVPAQPQTATSGCINYFANVSDAVGTMGCQTISASATSATLLASNFSRTGYGFAGWSDAFDYKTNTNAHFYGPNEDITFTAGQYTGSNDGLALYAVWVKSEGNLQSWSGCSSLTKADEASNIFSESITALSDSRDNNTYAVARLADGNCWMIENLRLDDSAILTTANTNNPLNNGTTVTLKHNYTDTDTYNTLSPTSSVAYDATTAPNGWCTTDSAACDDQSRLRTDNTANRATYASGATMNGNANIYGYGNYYNWYSATAGNGTYSTGSNVVAAGDICPAGWHLPYGGSGTGAKGGNTSGGFYYLNYKLNNDQNLTDSVASSKLRSYPQNFVYSGYVNGAPVSYRSSNGRYWSSTAYNSNNAYRLFFNSSIVSPGVNNDGKYGGRMARCVVAGS